MELRVLEYFITVAREQNISRAAEYLHLTQPTLSRQLKDLEDEFGKKLLVRGNRKITLTDEGALFREMAQEIVDLAKRAENEMKKTSDTLAGDIYIGTGESVSIENIISVAKKIQSEYPSVHFHFTSGDTSDLADRLDKGLFDFCIMYGDIDRSKYEYIELPYVEKWAVLMRNDSPLASKEVINVADLWDIPLILSRQALLSTKFFKWLGKEPNELTISNTYNLIYTGKIMAESGMGYVLTLDKLINTTGTNLIFRQIEPPLFLNLSLVWKKYRTQSRASEKFVEYLIDEFE